MVMIARIIFQLAVIYAIVVAVVYFFQRNLQYFPDRRAAGLPKDSGLPHMEGIAVATQDGLTLQGWYQPPRTAGGRVVVFFHGNAGHHAHRASKIIHFIEAGYGVYLCSYRGYGGNAGKPSEQGLYADGRAALDWLHNNANVAIENMIFYGESIGAGVAVHLAAENAPPVVILEAPFSTATDVARGKYFWLPVDMLMRDTFSNIDKIGGIATDLLIVHGDEDEVTPIALAQRLFERAQHPKEFITINGGHHSDLYEHHAGHVINDWLAQKGYAP